MEDSLKKRRNKRIRYSSSRRVLVHLHMVNYSEKINGLSILCFLPGLIERARVVPLFLQLHLTQNLLTLTITVS